MNMKNETLHNIRYKLSIIYGLIVIVFTIFSIIFSYKHDFEFQSIADVTNEFSKIYNGDSSVLLYRPLNDDEIGQSFSFFTKDLFVKAFVTNEIPKTADLPNDASLIYNWGESNIISKSPGQFRHFVTVNKTDYESEYVCILLIASDSHFTNFNVQIYEGFGGDIALLLTSYDFLDIVLTVMMLLFGIVITIIYLIQRHNTINNKSNFYIGILSIQTAVWSAMQLIPVQLMMDSGVTQMYIYCISMFSLPMFVLLYLESLIHISCNLENIAIIVLSMMCVTLHAAGILPFSVTSKAYLVICIFIMLSVLYKAYKSKTFRNHSKLLVTAFYFFIICVVLNVLLYIFVAPIEPSLTFAKFGLMTYIVAVLYNSIEGFVSNMLRAQEGNKIFDIAYTDNLTRVGNRYAFDRDINTLNLNYVCLVSCDVNNLKYYNDTFGHAQGDELLKKSVELLQSVYGQSVYRTGGDEFIVLLAMSSDEELKYKYDCLSKAMKKHNDKNGATLLVEIATGYSKYQEGDESYEDILRRADKNMYRDKKALKSVSPIKYER